jgi:hypothetical protein
VEDVPVLNSRILLCLGTALAASVSLGCKLGVVPTEAAANSGLALSPAAAKAASGPFNSKAKITGVKSSAPDDGMSHVQVRLTVDEAALAAPHFHLEAMPALANWKDAFVTLFSATANTAFVTGTHSVTIPKAAFSGVPLTATSVIATPLRPASDYVARCFIRNDVGGSIPLRLAASLEKTAVALDAGTNTINFNLTLNASESSYNIVASSSSFKNVVSDGYLVVGDVIDMNTGMDAAAPGVDHIDVVLTGAAYGGGTAILGRLASGALNTFHWDSSVDAGAPGTYSQATYAANGGNLATPATGTIEFRAYHADDGVTEFAKSVIPINVYKAPTVDIQVQ